MKKCNSKTKRKPAVKKWPLVLLIQVIITFLLAILLSLSLLTGGFLHGICLWGLTPLMGFISACIATRAGLLNYAALLVPPLMQIAANAVLWRYLPDPGPVFLCAFISLVGAATGEVLKRQHTR